MTWPGFCMACRDRPVLADVSRAALKGSLLSAPVSHFIKNNCAQKALEGSLCPHVRFQDRMGALRGWPNA